MHPVNIPQELVNDESVLLVEWMIPDGGEVKAGQAVALIETSKATAEIEAPRAGFLRRAAQQGTEVRVGAVCCYIADTATASLPSAAAPAAAAKPAPSRVPAPAAPARPPAAPAPAAAPAAPPVPVASADSPAPIESGPRFSSRARELLERHGLDKALFQGKGLIRESDVMAVLNFRAQAVAAAPSPSPSPEVTRPAPTAIVPASGVPVRTQDLSRMKRTEGKYLSNGFRHTLASVITVSCPTSGLKAAAASQPELGGNSTALLVFEAARLLRKYPVFNAYHQDGRVNFYEQVNVGVAVDAGQGLKVPVIMQADRKGMVEIAREVENLLLAYVSDTIPVAALAAGTFTITDLSGEGVFAFHPLINQGQSAILGVGAEYFPPGSRTGFFNLILAFDHQLTEGRTAAKFLQELRDRLLSYERTLRSGTADDGDPVCSRCARPLSVLSAGQEPLLEQVLPGGSRTPICRSCLLNTAS